jgi:Stage II sporulation protein E (SpoIIE)
VLVRGSVTDISERKAAEEARRRVAVERRERERDTADTLQHSLLPERIPEIPGVVIAALSPRRRALPGRRRLLRRLPDRGLALAPRRRRRLREGPGGGDADRPRPLHPPRRGDARAAPGGPARAAYDAILRQRSDGRYCTAVCATLDLRGDGVEVTLASGGHPLPMVLRADGSVQELGHSGTLLGIVAEVALEDVRAELHSGDTLLLYTDGLTEVHAPEAILGPDDVANMVARGAGLEPGELVRRLERDALGDSGDEPRDDLAIVAVHVNGAPQPPPAAGTSERDRSIDLPTAVPAPPPVAGGAPAPSRTAATPLALWIPPIRDAPTIARQAARRSGRLRGRTLETLELLLTELVTNSVRHAGLGPHDLIAVRIDERWGIDHDAGGARVWFELER